MAQTRINSESEERDECPECWHPWFYHELEKCTAPLCRCRDGKYPAWADPPPKET